MAKLEDIEGIGPVYAGKLREADIRTLEGLLKHASQKKQRKDLAEKSGISEAQILNWVNRADLIRIKGISTQYSDLLEFSGVDSVPELAQRNALNLVEKMTIVNSEKKLVRKVPSLKSVEGWIAMAKVLPKAVFH